MCKTAVDEVFHFLEPRRCQPASRVWLSHCTGSGYGPTLGREEAQASAAGKKVACCGEKLKELSLIS